MRQWVKPGDRVVYTGPGRDIGAVKTGTTGVVERVTASGDMACVRWDTVAVHEASYKDCRYLSPHG